MNKIHLVGCFLIGVSFSILLRILEVEMFGANWWISFAWFAISCFWLVYKPFSK